MRKHKKRMWEADCSKGKHAWVVSGTKRDEDGDVQIDRVCMVCRDPQSHVVSGALFVGIQLEHLWMAPDVRLGL